MNKIGFIIIVIKHNYNWPFISPWCIFFALLADIFFIIRQRSPCSLLKHLDNNPAEARFYKIESWQSKITRF